MLLLLKSEIWNLLYKRGVILNKTVNLILFFKFRRFFMRFETTYHDAVRRRIDGAAR